MSPAPAPPARPLRRRPQPGDYALSFEQRQRVEAAATALPAEQRPLFRQRVQQIVRVPMGRGIATDAMVGVAISAAMRELTEKVAS